MPEGPLFVLTSAVSFLGLVASLWLGFYVVTRNPRNGACWLAAATLWSLSGYYLNTLTHLQVGSGAGALPWWWGWSVAIGAPFWYHLSISVLPSHPAGRQRFLAGAIYLLALNLVGMEAYTPLVFAGATTRPAVFCSAQRPGPLYPLFGLYLVAVPVLCLYSLRRARSQAAGPAIQRQLTILIWATALAVLSGGYTTFCTWLRLDGPVLFGNLALGVAVLLLGYGVARYSALIEGRALGLDFTYTALGIALVIVAYLMAAFVSDWVFGVPFIAFIFVIMLAVISHSLYDWGRICLGRFFYRQRYGNLRADLRDFARAGAADNDLDERLEAVLQTLCQSLQASKGLVALREGEAFNVVASYGVDALGQIVAWHSLLAEEVTFLRPEARTRVLDGMALSVPLHASGEQIGAIALGDRIGGASYSEDDLDLLADLSDTVAYVVHTIRLQVESVRQIDALLQEFRAREQQLHRRMREVLAPGGRLAIVGAQSEKEATSLVEDALRHLQDYPYLGQHPLARLCLLDRYVEAQPGAILTHIDRGKALNAALTDVIARLRPAGPRPSPPTADWHQYVILHDCYVLGELNRDVMNALYISEGTFNRTRRRAIRALARALSEMESESAAGP